MSTNTWTASPAKRRNRLLALWRVSATNGVASEAIHITLREAILRGVLPAGERLGEVQLASLFKRSRTPVREALLRLETEGLAERSTRRGFVVGSISREEILEIYTVRTVLDGLAARLAAQGILPVELDHLRWLNGRARGFAEQQDFTHMLDVHLEFHQQVCRASRNTILLQFTRQIHDRVRRFRETSFAYPGRALEAVEEHEALLEALTRHDSDAAEHIACSHMTRAMQVRVAMLQSLAHEFARGGESWAGGRAGREE